MEKYTQKNIQRYIHWKTIKGVTFTKEYIWREREKRQRQRKEGEIEKKGQREKNRKRETESEKNTRNDIYEKK